MAIFIVVLMAISSITSSKLSTSVEFVPPNLLKFTNCSWYTFFHVPLASDRIDDAQRLAIVTDFPLTLSTNPNSSIISIQYNGQKKSAPTNQFAKPHWHPIHGVIIRLDVEDDAAQSTSEDYTARVHMHYNRSQNNEIVNINKHSRINIAKWQICHEWIGAHLSITLSANLLAM